MLNILVIEDDHIMLKAITNILSKSGYNVITAKDGKQAFTLLEEADYDVVVTDLMMPYANGLQVVSKVRKDASKKHIGIIVISSMGHEDTIIEAFELGADDYLKKPILAGELLSRIRKVYASKKNQEKSHAPATDAVIAHNPDVAQTDKAQDKLATAETKEPNSPSPDKAANNNTVAEHSISAPAAQIDEKNKSTESVSLPAAIAVAGAALTAGLHKNENNDITTPATENKVAAVSVNETEPSHEPVAVEKTVVHAEQIAEPATMPIAAEPERNRVDSNKDQDKGTTEGELKANTGDISNNEATKENVKKADEEPKQGVPVSVESAITALQDITESEKADIEPAIPIPVAETEVVAVEDKESKLPNEIETAIPVSVAETEALHVNAEEITSRKDVGPSITVPVGEQHMHKRRK